MAGAAEFGRLRWLAHAIEKRMQITVIHNPKAGRGDFDCDELKRTLRSAGHDAECHSIKKRNYRKALKHAGDLVLVAGGDGTVAKVARQLIGRDVPLSVLPIGTANNLARTLGFTGTAEEILASLESGTLRRFDAARACGACGKRYFFEGAGGGLLPHYWRKLARLVETAPKMIGASRQRQMAAHVTMLRRLLRTYQPVRWEIIVDGKELTHDYLLLEAMNIRSVGPILSLAPQAVTDDGRLDLVTVRENEREKFCDYLEARVENHAVEFPFRARRFRQLQISGLNVPLHFDDKIWPKKNADLPQNGEIEITVEPSALTVLLPPNNGE